MTRERAEEPKEASAVPVMVKLNPWKWNITRRRRGLDSTHPWAGVAYPSAA